MQPLVAETAALVAWLQRPANPDIPEEYDAQDQAVIDRYNEGGGSSGRVHIGSSIAQCCLAAGGLGWFWGCVFVVGILCVVVIFGVVIVHAPACRKEEKEEDELLESGIAVPDPLEFQPVAVKRFNEALVEYIYQLAWVYGINRTVPGNYSPRAHCMQGRLSVGLLELTTGIEFSILAPMRHMLQQSIAQWQLQFGGKPYCIAVHHPLVTVLPPLTGGRANLLLDLEMVAVPL